MMICNLKIIYIHKDPQCLKDYMILIVLPGLPKESSSKSSMLWKLLSRDQSALDYGPMKMLSSALSKNSPLNLLAISKKCSKLMNKLG